jgi:nucleotidyltransferase substrate binding protein (TIGR01987 family)
MNLDLTTLQNAIGQLEEALQYGESALARSDPRLARHLRAAAIQAFEFTYELSVKMLRRYLEATEPNPAAIGELSFNELIRLGTQRGLLAAPLAQWQEFRRDRGTTSHVYDQKKADEVFASIPPFLSEAIHLLGQIQQRQDRAS